jgi:hypothetical protein
MAHPLSAKEFYGSAAGPFTPLSLARDGHGRRCGSLCAFGLPLSRPRAQSLRVIPRVVLAGLRRVMGGMVVMPVSDVGVMPRLLVIVCFMLLGRGQVVLRRVLVMLRRLAVMIYGFLGHGISSLEILLDWCLGSMNPARY